VSFLSRGAYGELELPLTLENYKRVAGFGLLGFDPLYPTILGRSVLIAAATALLCVICSLPVAFFHRWPFARAGKLIGLTLLVIPFWTNLLVRTYAWQILLDRRDGITHVAMAISLG
jgi:spermidine/putrescine transport system permease protein